jgi:hypothetical protein
MSLKLMNDPIVIKRREVYGLRQAFQNLMKYPGEKFSAFVSKNAKRLDGIIENARKKVEEIKPTGDKIDNYIKAEEVIFTTYAKKDAAGKPIHTPQGFYDIPKEVQDQLNDDLKQVREEHKEAWDRIEDFKKQQEDYMDTEIELDIHRIYSFNLPSTITGADRYHIEDYIVERDVEPEKV